MKYQFVEKQVYVNGYKLSYLEGGITSNSEPILFIHGWGVSVEPYQEIINVLCQRHKVIAPALPGFGRSDGDRIDWDYDKYANFLLAFLQKLDINKVHLIGHSLGGGINITLAARVPDIVSSIILVDSTGIPVDPIPKVLFQRLIEMTAQTPQIKFPQIKQIFQGFSYNLLFHTQNTIRVLLLALKKDIKSLLPQ
ncbi:MAG TPA: alpha/beta hydrolase, partial [Cyanobacteria bacterium UBA11049]|nr:alpha/beta hydrolase [Cyanobacteria bacterium UBA11049]